MSFFFPLICVTIETYRCVIHVNLGERDAWVGLGQLGEFRTDHLARPAPFSAEVDHNQLVLGNERVELFKILGVIHFF